MLTKNFVSAASIVFVLALLTSTTNADNSWGLYHWARTTDSFDLTVVNSTTSDWDFFEVPQKALSDWSISTKLNMVKEEGSTSKKVRRGASGASPHRLCQASTGSVH